jgi:hypothetical protein
MGDRLTSPLHLTGIPLPFIPAGEGHVRRALAMLAPSNCSMQPAPLAALAAAARMPLGRIRTLGVRLISLAPH